MTKVKEFVNCKENKINTWLINKNNNIEKIIDVKYSICVKDNNIISGILIIYKEKQERQKITEQYIDKFYDK